MPKQLLVHLGLQINQMLFPLVLLLDNPLLHSHNLVPHLVQELRVKLHLANQMACHLELVINLEQPVKQIHRLVNQMARHLELVSNPIVLNLDQ